MFFRVLWLWLGFLVLLAWHGCFFIREVKKRRKGVKEEKWSAKESIFKKLEIFSLSSQSILSAFFFKSINTCSRTLCCV